MDMTKEKSSTLRDAMRRAIVDAWLDGALFDGFDVTREQFYRLEMDGIIEAVLSESGAELFPMCFGKRVYVVGTALARPAEVTK
jgi:hypothetical protein